MVLKVILICLLSLSLLCGESLALFKKAETVETVETVKLPKPRHKGDVSVEQAIYERKSIRRFSGEPLTLKEVSQLLWAAGGTTVDGVTGPTRAFPSAGAVYPLEIYLVAGNVTGLPSGVYHYDWKKHSLALIKKGDLRADLSKAAYSQRMVQTAPASIVVAAVHDKTSRRYGERGAVRYVSMDTGHLGQNVHLQAQSMGLGTVMVGAFMDKKVLDVIDAKNELPVYIMPVGHPEK